MNFFLFEPSYPPSGCIFRVFFFFLFLLIIPPYVLILLFKVAQPLPEAYKFPSAPCATNVGFAGLVP